MKKQPTKRQLQIVENFIKNETKRIMNESPVQDESYRIIRYLARQGWDLGLEFTDEATAKKVVNFLNSLGDKIINSDRLQFKISKL